MFRTRGREGLGQHQLQLLYLSSLRSPVSRATECKQVLTSCSSSSSSGSSRW
jgi:hypothetical protein